MERDALAGLRVVDFSWAASGPLCTLYMALHGAEVIKVESIKSLDLARRGYYTLVDDIDASPNFNDMHLNKMSVRLNLADPRAAGIARDLVRISDVVVENFRPGTMEKFGLHYAALKSIKPDLLMISASTGGQTGPERNLPGYATVFGAMGGFSHLTGHADGPSSEIWDSIDMRLGTAISLAAVIGVYHQRKHGRGQHVDLSSREVISTLIGDAFFDFTMNGRAPGRRGNRDDVMAPHGCYPCRGKDRWISIAVGTDEEWLALCRVAGRPGWATDTRFADRFGRWRRQDDLDTMLAAWTLGCDAADLTRRLQEAGVPAMPSMDTETIVNDQHSQAREIFLDVEHPRLGMTHPVRPPWVLSETPFQVKRHAPMFGEHNTRVFRDLLGYAEPDLAALEATGVFQ